jgi:hypothetical protein
MVKNKVKNPNVLIIVLYAKKAFTNFVSNKRFSIYIPPVIKKKKIKYQAKSQIFVK